MIRLGSLAGYAFEGPRILAGWTPPKEPAVYAIVEHMLKTETSQEMQPFVLNRKPVVWKGWFPAISGNCHLQCGRGCTPFLEHMFLSGRRSKSPCSFPFLCPSQGWRPLGPPGEAPLARCVSLFSAFAFPFRIVGWGGLVGCPCQAPTKRNLYHVFPPHEKVPARRLPLELKRKVCGEGPISPTRPPALRFVFGKWLSVALACSTDAVG